MKKNYEFRKFRFNNCYFCGTSIKVYEPRLSNGYLQELKKCPVCGKLVIVDYYRSCSKNEKPFSKCEKPKNE